jgi:SAM-dependent methyltransferase
MEPDERDGNASLQSSGDADLTLDASLTPIGQVEAERLLDRLVRPGIHRITLEAGSEDSVSPARAGTTAWWEQRLLERGFGKSPSTPGQPCRIQRTADGSVVRHPVHFVRLSHGLEARFPLSSLKAERDLHMDMLREAGARSDAHLARYRLARDFVTSGVTVVDAACGLGYGTALLADTTSAARLHGVDSSDYAVEYGRTAWCELRPQIDFALGDVRSLSLESGSADCFVSFETLEHLESGDAFLAEVHRVLAPGGSFVGSVPNLWADATGQDPSPYHFQVFDRERLLATLDPLFDVQALWQQNAALDIGDEVSPALFHRIGLDGAGVVGKPEWLVFAALRR